MPLQMDITAEGRNESEGSDALRVLHLPDVVGGHPTALAMGERALGASSETLSYTQSPFGYRPEKTLKYTASSAVMRWGERLATFARIRNDYDVFHFNFGRSLLTPSSGRWPLPELGWYARNALKVMTFQGSDARTAYDPVIEQSLEAERALGNEVDSSVWSSEGFASRRRRSLVTIDRAAKYCDRLYALNPDLLAEMPAELSSFFPYAIDPNFERLLSDATPLSRRSQRHLHVVHLSTNRILKGTGLIEKALRQAQGGDDLDLTFEIVFRADRRSALAALARADVVIDQMVLGWYGAAAVEACYLKKPVIAWISEAQAKHAPLDLIAALPFVVAPHSGIADALKTFSRNREQLIATGERGLEFALKWHDPVTVARQSLASYKHLIGARRMDMARRNHT